MDSAKNLVSDAYYNFQPQVDINGSADYTKGLKPSYNLFSEVNWNSPIGTTVSFQYTPSFLSSYGNSAAGGGTLIITQPLLKGFGLAFNTTALRNQFASFNQSALSYKSDEIGRAHV